VEKRQSQVYNLL